MSVPLKLQYLNSNFRWAVSRLMVLNIIKIYINCHNLFSLNLFLVQIQIQTVKAWIITVHLHMCTWTLKLFRYDWSGKKKKRCITCGQKVWCCFTIPLYDISWKHLLNDVRSNYNSQFMIYNLNVYKWTINVIFFLCYTEHCFSQHTQYFSFLVTQHQILQQSIVSVQKQCCLFHPFTAQETWRGLEHPTA